MSAGGNLLDMELRHQNLEKEINVLKDVVWRLTGRIFVLETFLSEKFDELVVDFGLRLNTSHGGNANFLAQAMQAEATIVRNIHDPLNNEMEDNETGGTDMSSEMNIDEAQNHNGSEDVKGQIRMGLVTGRGGTRHASRFLNRNRGIIHAPVSIDERHSTTEGEDDGDNNNYHSQTDFMNNVEEFVVFPPVPEFNILNGSSENLMSSAESSNSETDLHHHHRQKMGPTNGTPHSVARRNPRFKCVPCSKLFTSEWHLKAHLIKHSDSVLTTSVTNPDGSPNLPQHQDSSSNNSNAGDNQKPFACVYCGKAFKKRQELTVHVRIHTGEKPFTCPVCARGFSQSSSMKTHLRIHTGQKPFKCKQCKSVFTVKMNYMKHLQTAHNNVS